MFDVSTLQRDSDDKFQYVTEYGKKKEYEQLFPIEEWDSEDAFKFANIKGYEPMTAKELDTEEKQDEVLNSKDYYIEEKFDGTRAIVQFFSQRRLVNEGDFLGDNTHLETVGYCRVFSRRISKKTGFYVENTDSLPQIREINVPSLDGTVLDGEMFINGRPFKDVSSTLNCTWDKAIDRQIEKGFISFHAFDILKYKGIDLRNMPLERRKVYLHLAVQQANSPYIEEVKFYECGSFIVAHIDDVLRPRIKDKENEDLQVHLFLENLDENVYPNLKECYHRGGNITPRAYYELIVATEGEGVIVKPKKGKYLHKRGWEYSKIKKYLTRELILIDFSEPTREYQGKAPKNWGYYDGDTPVTKYYYNRQVGNMKLGVLITEEEYNKLPKNKQGQLYAPSCVKIYNHDELFIMEVCECGGYSDDERAYFTRNKDKLIGSVIEVKANEIMRDSGRLRHPRYLRVRNDKAPEVCTWSDHII